MSDVFRLVHFSDVHLAPITGFHPRYWNAKRGLGLLNWQRGRRSYHLRSVADRIAADALTQAPDHVTVTGDLVNLGLPAEYEAARSWLDALGDASSVSVVPGNHDIYTSRLHGASCLETWAPYMTTIDEAAANNGAAGFPFVRVLGRVALIGLCSAVPTPPFQASGALGDRQLSELGAALSDLHNRQLVRVVLIHHPPLPGQAPPRRALKDADALERVIDAHGAELILHGHNHTETLAWRHATHGAVPVIGVPSASQGRVHPHEPLARYNLFTIAGSGSMIRITRCVRGLREPDGDVVELSRKQLEQPSSASI